MPRERGQRLVKFHLRLKKISGRYKAVSKTISGVYKHEYGEQSDVINRVRSITDEFAEKSGRRPRIMIAKIGQDGHDRGAKVIATAFADLGFDVDVGPLFQTPVETAKQAVENDVHVVGMSSLAGGHKTLLPELRKELNKLGGNEILILCGGVIPRQEYEFLYNNGADLIFGPGTKIPDAALTLMEKINSKFIN